MLVTANATLILPVCAGSHSRKLALSSMTTTTWWVLSATGAALLLVTCWPPLVSAFRFETLSAVQWMTSMVCGVMMLPLFGVVRQFSARVFSRLR